MQWDFGQQQPTGMPWQYIQHPLAAPLMMPQIPPQVLVAFKLLDNLYRKEMPVVAVNDISIEEIQRKDLLPIEEKSRAVALETLMAYMMSALR